jgi:anthranilate phosphoribosyltransferase
VRRELGVRTVFNVIGPLTNPAGAQTQVIGVADRKLVPLMGEALLRLGCRRALIVYGEDGLDEISLSAPTLVCEIDGAEGTGRTYHLTPELLGLRVASRESVLGGDATTNARIMRGALAGREGEPVTDMVAANAGAALYASGHASTLADGTRLAFDTIRSGRATATLDAFVAATHDVATVTAG